jgi:hypothetical protein
MSKIRLNGSSSGYTELTAAAAAGSGTLTLPTASGTVLATDSSGNVNIDSGTFYVDAANNKVLVGTNTASTNTRLDQKVGIVSTGTSNFGGLSVTSYCGTDAGAASVIDFQRSRGTADGSLTEVANGDVLGYLVFRGADGAAFSDAAMITSAADGDWTTSGDTTDSPGRLVFSTTADGASSPTERARITSGGAFLVNTTSDFGGYRFGVVQASAACEFLNRTGNDGGLLDFYQDGTQEGGISVSGTTVSYNGAHLSRYSQLPGGAERTEILRGTVLSNIDEMCAWGEEDNEQLNRMKVSDVEGDPNVSGVFQSWDDDDDTYTDDFYCAMTGDFIIRIAEGVTVQRGDLLMSAGDGTAKPQDDDIIRSKTIAKVTSTHVTCTYDDGSYCVPCVLMAC